MNALQFANHILKKMKQDTAIKQWYECNLKSTQLSETEQRLSDAVARQELTLNQAIQLALFIGLTTLPEEQDDK